MRMKNEAKSISLMVELNAFIHLPKNKKRIGGTQTHSDDVLLKLSHHFPVFILFDLQVNMVSGF